MSMLILYECGMCGNTFRTKDAWLSHVAVNHVIRISSITGEEVKA
jgi:hypothetical protein